MTQSNRQADHDILPIFTERWSPRSFTDEAMPDDVLHVLFEAARWAPSAFNSQPWRFVHARRGGPDWDLFVSLLNPYNQEWARHAAVLVYVLSAPTYIPDGKTDARPTTNRSFDCGTAWGYLALQAHALGWAAHGMAGIETDRIPAALNAPEGFQAEIAIAIGRLGPIENLSESFQKKEFPSQRRPAADFAFAGRFPDR